MGTVYIFVGVMSFVGFMPFVGVWLSPSPLLAGHVTHIKGT